MTATDLVVEILPDAGPLDEADDFYLTLTGASGSRASTPDNAALDITTDFSGAIELRAPVAFPTSGGGYEVYSKYTSAGNQRSWHLRFGVNGGMTLFWSPDGTAVLNAESTVPLPRPLVGSLTVGWWIDVDSGGSTRTITFYARAGDLAGLLANLSTSILGTAVVQSGTTSVFSSTAPLDIGDLSGTSDPPFFGIVRRAQLRSGNLSTGTIVANPDFTLQTPGTTSFTDSATRSWSVNSPAAIVGFTWVDVSDRLLYATWTTGRGPGQELDPVEPGSAKLVLKNDDRHLDPEYTAGPWFGMLKPRVPVRIRSIATALDLPGSGGATASTPDHSSFAVTDLDVRVRLAMDDWTPGGFGQFVVGQWPNSPGNNGWVLAVQPSGVLRLAFTSNGTTTLDRDSTAATGFTDGSDHWIRATLDVNNGAAGHDARFYTSTDGVTWTQLGSTVTTAGTTSIFNSTAALAVGDVLSLAGQVRYVEVRDGINGSIVTNPEFSSQPPATTSFKCPQDRTWSVNGAAAVAFDTTVLQDEFYGFVESGWEPDYHPPALANCDLGLIDMLGVIAGSSLPKNAYELEVFADRPRLHWGFDESEGALQAADSSGYGRHGTIDNGILGRDSLIAGEGHAMEFPNDGDNRVSWSGEGLPVGPPCSLEAWVELERDLLSVKSIIVAQRDTSLTSAVWFKVDSSVGSPNGELLIHFHGLGTGYKARGDTRVDDGRRHHVVVTIAGNTPSDVLLYVDGTAETKTTVTAGNPGPWASHLLWTAGNSADNGVGDYGLGGVADEPAVYDYVLTPERVAAHYIAGLTGGDGDRSGVRVGDVLDHIGLPATMRDIAEGDTTVGPANYGGQKAGPYLDSVVESEQGHLYVAHRNGGKVTFKGRYDRFTADRSTATLATFSDQDTPSALHYESIDVPAGSAKTVVNIVDVNWRGGVLQVVDPNGSHLPGGLGPQSRTINTEAATASAAYSPGAWIINNYASPQARVQGFELNPGADKRLRRPGRDLQFSDRIATVRHPQSVGDPTTNLLYVEGLTHTFERGRRHTVEVVTSKAVLGDWFIWDVSEWDVNTVWG